MSKIKLVVEIDEKDYEELNTFYILNLGTEEYRKNIEKHCTDAIRHGTPLPKGHGRLVDVDKLIGHCGNCYGLRAIDCYGNCDKCEYYVVRVDDIREAKTIVDADKENDNATSN